MAKRNLVIFDLDDTLFSEATYLFSVVQKYLISNGSGVSVLSEFEDRIVLLRREREDILGAILHDLNLDRTVHHEGLFEEYCTHTSLIEPFDGVNELVNQLLDLNFRIVVLTNGVVDSQRSKWDALNILRKDEIVFFTARSLGGDKPNEETFEHVLSDSGFRWDQVIVVGDKFENDIRYPVSQGAAGFLIQKNCKDKSQIDGNIERVVNIKELTDLLNQVGFDV